VSSCARRKDEAHQAGTPLASEYRYEGLGEPMKSYDAGPTDTPIFEVTIGASFERTVAQHPDREALVDVIGSRRWTYAELNEDVDVVARGLMGLGISEGDRVGIWSPNCAECRDARKIDKTRLPILTSLRRVARAC
jgi:non-ribosomal peptide synthetase component F